MRLALVSDFFHPRVGGIELHVRDLALALRADGIDARVITATPGERDVEGVPVHRVPSPLLPGAGLAVSPRIISRLHSVLIDEQFDVVHAHGSIFTPVAYAGAIAAARAGLPTVLTLHSMLYRASLLLAAVDAWFGLSKCLVLSAVSSVVAAQAVRWVPEASVAVLPNAIDARFWRATPPNRSGDSVHFVSALRLSRKKRPLELVRAFAEAVRFTAGTPALRLTIAGDGYLREHTARLAAELGVRDRVELPGAVSRADLRTLYGHADAFVLPSERESFGIAALEARTAGLPVIGMLASGVRDFIVPGINGLLARDQRELAHFMARLALDESLRRFMANNNVTEPPVYDWPTVVVQHRAVYDRAIAARRRMDLSIHT